MSSAKPIETETELFDYLAQCGIGRIEVMFDSKEVPDHHHPEPPHWFVYDINGNYLPLDDFLWDFGGEGDNKDQPPLGSLIVDAYRDSADVINRNVYGKTEYDDARVIFDISARTISLQVTQKLEGSTWRQIEQEGWRRFLEQEQQKQGEAA